MASGGVRNSQLDERVSAHKPKCTRIVSVATARAAVKAAGEPKCSRFSGYWLISSPDGDVAVPIRCKSHRCPSCRKFKALAAAVVLQRGLDKAKGRARLLTLTDGRGDMTSADVAAAWRRFSLRLKRRGLLGETFTSLEATKKGRLHLHAVVIESERGGGFIDNLGDLAAASGFGKVADVREVKTGGGKAKTVAQYLTKGGVAAEATKLASYLTKTANTDGELREKLGERLRPVNVSRGFLGGGLAATEKEICRYFAEAAEAEVPEVWEMWREEELATTREEWREFARLRELEDAERVSATEEEPPAGKATTREPNDRRRLKATSLSEKPVQLEAVGSSLPYEHRKRKRGERFDPAEQRKYEPIRRAA